MQGQVPNCVFDTGRDGEFYRLALMANDCTHIRCAANPRLQNGGASAYLDVLVTVCWPCLKQKVHINTNCHRSITSALMIVCKQRLGGSRELEKPIYIYARVRTLDPELLTIVGKSSLVSREEVILGPVRFQPTPCECDHDTEAFRVVLDSQLISHPIDSISYAKVEITLLASYSQDCPKNWSCASRRKVIIAATVAKHEILIKEENQVNHILELSGPKESRQINENSTTIIKEFNVDKMFIQQQGIQAETVHTGDVHFTQEWEKLKEQINLVHLGEELEKLRMELRRLAKTPEEDKTLGVIAEAEQEAKSQNGARALQMLATLGKAGRWVFDTATQIGVLVAAKALQAALGL